MNDMNVGMAFDPEAILKAFRMMGEVAAEVGFRLTAQAALGHILQDQVEQTGALLDRMTRDQRIRLWVAAGALTGLAGVGLEQPPAEQAAAGEQGPPQEDDLRNQLNQKIGVIRADLALEVVRPYLDAQAAQVATMTEVMERVPEAHMRFGIVGDPRPIDEMPCADWCYACKLEHAEGEADRLRALATVVLDACEADPFIPRHRFAEWRGLITEPGSKVVGLAELLELARYSLTKMTTDRDAHRRRLAAALGASPFRDWDQLLTLAEQTHDTAIARQAEAERLRVNGNDALDRVSKLADQLDEQAGPDRDWSVRAEDAAARIRAAITGPDDTSKEPTTP